MKKRNLIIPFKKRKKVALWLLLSMLISISSCNIGSNDDSTPTEDKSETNSGDSSTNEEGGETNNTNEPEPEFPLIGEWTGTINNTTFKFTFSESNFNGCGTYGDIVKIVKTSSNSGYFVFKYTKAYAKTLIGYYGVGKWRDVTPTSTQFCEEVKDSSSNSNIFDPVLYDSAARAEAELKDSSFQDYVYLDKN